MNWTVCGSDIWREGCFIICKRTVRLLARDERYRYVSGVIQALGGARNGAKASEMVINLHITGSAQWS